MASVTFWPECTRMEFMWYMCAGIVVLCCLDLTFGLQRYYMEDSCESTLDMDYDAISAGRLAVTRRAKYRNKLNCHVTIMAPKDRRLTIVFRELEIEWEDICDDDFVQLFDGTSVNAPMVKGLERRLCGHRVPKGGYTTSGEALTVFFQSDLFRQDDGFEIVFTAFHKSDPCNDGEFRCDNGKCIDGSLECNNFQNCGDGSDDCHVTAEVLMSIVLSVFLLTVIGVGAITIYRKKKKQRMSFIKQPVKVEMKSKSCTCGSECPCSKTSKKPARKWRPATYNNLATVWTTDQMTDTANQHHLGDKEERALQHKRASV